MTTHAPMARVPFAPLDNPRLQHLASAKNRQNGAPKQISSDLFKDAKVSVSKSTGIKRSYEPAVFDDFDSENVDPDVFNSPSKKSKSDVFDKPVKPFTFSMTSVKAMPPPSAVPSRSSTPARATISITRAPSTAPVGRSPTRKVAGIKSKRRISAPFSRIDPPAFGLQTASSSLPFSLDAAISGSLPSSKVSSAGATIQESMPKNWFFEIYEDTPEEEAANLMEHSTLTLDLSSDDECEKKCKDDRGKENTPPEGYDAPVASSSATVAAPHHIKKVDIIRRKIALNDDMDDGARSPLNDLETEHFIPEGLPKDAHIIVDDVVDVEGKEVLPFEIEDLVAVPPPSAEKTESEVAARPVVDEVVDVKSEIIIWEDRTEASKSETGAEDVVP